MILHIIGLILKIIGIILLVILGILLLVKSGVSERRCEMAGADCL